MGLLLVWWNNVIEKLTRLIFYCRLMTKTKGDSTPTPTPKQLNLIVLGCWVCLAQGSWDALGWLGVELSKCYALRGKEVGVLWERREAQFPKGFHTRDAEQQRGIGWWDKEIHYAVPRAYQMRCAYTLPGDLVKMQFWFRRSEVGPEILHFQQAPKQSGYCWSCDPTLRNKGWGVGRTSKEGHGKV